MIKKLFLNETFILALIIINAIIVFIGAFELNDITVSQILFYTDHAITILFIIELYFKVREYGFTEYISSNWNKLDFLLVLLSVPSFLIFFNLNLDLSYLLIFRLLRIFKFFRFIRFVPGIENLIKGIIRALRTSVLVILGFTVYLFIISLFSCYLFRDSSPELYGDPLKALYSTFKLFTVEGWYDIPESIITDTTAPTLRILINLYFILVMITGGIFGLSLVNSIFVDAMVSDNNDELIEKVNELDKKIEKLINKN
ncbi:ion transporter [uncultured Draconibacterium sp.]|uniref:ion transporter n=1 Tax=uncultured Draconibacterium sp. TaxID=1573823 RepID=UPI0029C92E7E|nr:ion transporter [uncultured Draconibacterium sp.]